MGPEAVRASRKPSASSLWDEQGHMLAAERTGILGALRKGSVVCFSVRAYVLRESCIRWVEATYERVNGVAQIGLSRRDTS